jgi:pimeloyl-ACP methyl ester carboxylesterase
MIKKVLKIASCFIVLAIVAAGTVYLRATSKGAPLVSHDKSIKLVEAPCPKDYGGGRCGYVEAPLDYTGKEPGTIRAGFIYYPAVNPFATRTTMVISGGPGNVLSSNLTDGAAFFTRLGFRNTALIAVDARGLGLSTQIKCRPFDREHYSNAVSKPENAKLCSKDIANLSIHYSTANAVRDYDRIRSALGVKKVDVIGFSYGTMVIPIYAALFPNSLRHLVLDGALPLPASGISTTYKAKEIYVGMIRQFNDICERSKMCNREGIKRAVAAVITELRKQPRHVDLENKKDLPNFVEVTPQYLAMLLTTAPTPGSANGKEFIFHPIYGAILKAEKGDWTLFDMVIRNYVMGLYQKEGPDRNNNAVLFSVWCNGENAPFDLSATPQQKAEQYKRYVATWREGEFAPFTNEEWAYGRAIGFSGHCLAFEGRGDKRLSELHGSFSSRLPKDAKVLVVNGDLDMQTSLEEALLAAAQFPKAQFARFKHDGHAVIPANTCAVSLVDEFLENGFVRNPDRCLDSNRLPYVIDRMPTPEEGE